MIEHQEYQETLSTADVLAVAVIVFIASLSRIVFLIEYATPDSFVFIVPGFEMAVLLIIAAFALFIAVHSLPPYEPGADYD